MSEEAQVVAGSAWGGGVSPFAINSKKLGMWLFIVSDTLTFSALIVAYSYIRISTPNWPRPFEIWPAIIKSTVMTVALLSSSLTMVFAVSASQKGQRSKAVKLLMATMFFGAVFVVLHATEWVTLITQEHVTPWSNPWGVPMFGGAFFGLTGMHMLHVTIGIIYLGVMALGFGRGKFTAEDVEVSGLYWHFVDLVWMFIFPLVYLLSVNMKG